MKANAEGRDPSPVGLELEAGVGGIEGSQHEQRLHEGHQRDRDAKPARKPRIVGGEQKSKQGANQGQQRGESEVGHGYRMSMSCLKVRRVCQRASSMKTLAV